MLEEDREYYRRVWGFDPDVDRIQLAGGEMRYRADFPLSRDPGLTAAGVKIAAEVTFHPRGKIYNHIVFSRGHKVAKVNCTHTVIYSGKMEDALTWAQDTILTNFTTLAEQGLFARAGTVSLPPEEHFVALKSYVAALAEAGVENLLGGGNPPEWDGRDLGLSQPFGFNAAMRAQVVAALRAVAEQAMNALLRNVFAELASTAGAEWFRSRLILLDGIYFHDIMREYGNLDYTFKTGLSGAFAQFLLEDLDYFEMLYEIAPLVKLIRVVMHWPDTPPRVFNFLAAHVEPETWVAPDTPPPEDWDDLPILDFAGWAREIAHYYRRIHVTAVAVEFALVHGVPGAIKWYRHHERTLGFRFLNHPNCPQSVLAVFTRHPDPIIRAFVPLHRDIGPQILVELASDPDEHVRLSVGCNPKTPDAVLEGLGQDSDPNVRFAATRTLQSPERALFKHA
ncbi:MAG TPA: HEAT repeat domain-containing protein [Candidatus Lokiarchaeia archaeon]|nr:HEAT repeat domain-containing protein [Candidatus Lokiarchaeia archaeon]